MIVILRRSTSISGHTNIKVQLRCPGIVNRISYSKERLSEDTESLAAELKEKMMSLVEIYG